MNVEERDAFKIEEFCRRHGIGRTTYFEMKKAGKGPREMRIGSSVRISREAAEEWRRKIEAETEAA